MTRDESVKGAARRRQVARKLMAVYSALHRAYGPQRWWPGDTPFEVMAGAVLTQNTAWSNVEKAIANLKREKVLTPSGLHAIPPGRLAALIRPSGYYNIKAKRLLSLLEFLVSEYRGSLKKMFAEETSSLRRRLLAVNGIGPETADSILLYAGGKPVFVIDAYTKRIFSRHGIIPEIASYHDVQQLFMEHLPHAVRLFNEYHALLVRLGKERCRKRNPRCEGCPLESFLPGRR